ncbi:glycosyl hydrolase family 28-related protein [Pseudaestuariivita sp.]|uniref:glycosyl hydrolase family 28-related protein n=1 Tax=Pseudaestuariivita sp. TaxID=2211669 RepID=UPI0040587FE7
MNKAISDGIEFMPAPFADGLGAYSSGDGRPGSPTYQNAANAAFVPADQDFGGCLELVKQSGTTRVLYTGRTPILPGCYLRITVRLKAVSGALPNVRIGAWAGRGNNNPVTGVPLAGPQQSISTYGDVVEVSAIVGTGDRDGVDLVWGMQPDYGHFGIDLTGPNGGVVRIDDFVIEDLTSAFLRDMVPYVDVRDYGAIGNGVFDNTDAFEAADDAANGRRILVPEGTYRVNSTLTLHSEMEFIGRLSMPSGAILRLVKDFSLPPYLEAFDDEEVGFRKAVQALFSSVDHETLDMRGRVVSVSEPIDMQAAVGSVTVFKERRQIRNGTFYVEGSGGPWATDVRSSQGTYSTSDNKELRNVSNIANIPVGSLVTGNGVGREIYVMSRNVGAQRLTLSAPLYDAEGTQNYTFRRFKPVLDFTGFDQLSKFELQDIEFVCNFEASGIALAPTGATFNVRDCIIDRPMNRGIWSCGTGCQGLLVDRCQFLSGEFTELAQNRVTIALNGNSNDVKLRNNRSTRLRHFAVLRSAQNIVTGNHFFQGDSATNGIRTAGIVLAGNTVNTTISSNYIDNCFIEWTNESDETPDFSSGFSFAGCSITNNICLTTRVAPWFAFLVVKPYGSGNFLNGIAVTGNMFRALGGSINRPARVDTTFSNLDHSRNKDVLFEGNTYHNVRDQVMNPALIEHDQNSAESTWEIDCSDYLPFEARTRQVEGFANRERIRSSGGSTRYIAPYFDVGRGSGGQEVHAKWGEAVSGRIAVKVRMDS